MIYLFSGDDTLSRRAFHEKFLKSLPKEIEVFLISRNDFNQEQIESFYSGSGLFFNQCVVVLQDILEREDSAGFILKNLKSLVSSENIFIFLEGKHNKPILDAFKKAGAEVSVFELDKKKGKKEKFDSFVLANALGNRDKLSLWMNFCRAMEAEVALEELSGILFWKAKDMILKKNFGKFSEGELKSFASRISVLLPESRRQGRDSEAAFEEFLLNM